jgi:hypothetical protein
VTQQTHIRQPIELLRLSFASGIVWFHMHVPGERIACSAVFRGLGARRSPLPGVGRIPFGICMVHPFFVLVYHKLFAGDGLTVAAGLRVFALSCLTTVAMLRMPVPKAAV